ncbi:hypothetical protein [Brevundimonas sp.]|uniref:hypothetical protein n=1 Tax=Brevundimonas sp. TaxID=1871086 RepID=UPI0028A59B2C|nr:hypothetical protein [Brevundimonas sp.]
MTNRADILWRLSAQNALLGAVTPNLRSFSVDLSAGTITCQAVFETEPTDEERELIQIATTEILASFHDEMLDERFFVSAGKVAPKNLTHTIYQRHEPQENS